MAFSVIAIRSPEDNGDLRYPDVTTQDNPQPVSLESADGTAITRVRAHRIAVYHDTGSALLPLIAPTDLELEVIITDTRVIVASRKFDQGHTWGGLGGAAVVAAGVLTVISKTRAAHRRRGKTLAGHIRYPWIDTIAVNQRTNRRNGQPILHILITDNHGRRLVLELVFPPLTTVAELAHHLTHRAVSHRLTTHGLLTPDERANLEHALQAGPLDPQGNPFRSLNLPGSHPVPDDSDTQRAPALGSGRTNPSLTATGSTHAVSPPLDGPGQLRRCIRAGCANYGVPVTTPRCPACDTTTQRVNE